MKFNLKEVWKILDSRERKKVILVTILQSFSGLLDLVGILSIIPFLTIVTNPNILSTNKYFNLVQDWTNFNNTELIIFFGLISLLAIMINQTFRIYTAWYVSLVNQSVWRNMTQRMFIYYLSQNYPFHLKNNSYVMLEKLSKQVNSAQAGVIVPIQDLLGFLFSSSFIMGALFFMHPVIVLVSIIFFGIFYTTLFQVYKKRFEKLGSDLAQSSSSLYRLYGDAFGSIKEIKILHNEKYYKSLFKPLANKHSNALTKSKLFTELPNGFAEVIGFGGLMLLTLLLLFTVPDFKTIVPTLGLFAFAIKRIIPAVNGIYKQVSVIKFYHAAFNTIKKELTQAFEVEEEKNKNEIVNKKIEFNNMIELDNLSFSYDSSKQKVLDSISLKIKKGSFLGITGTTGSGKTTLIDIILGLLYPKSGKILIDGKLLDEKNLSSWHSKIGYVGQEGFLSDDTITKNIAFGVENEKIDIKKVVKSAKLAEIDDFIEKQLENKYDTIVGERGIRLSGGQRQRLRIARAFYRDPNILILDEATNALDASTEEKVMESIKKLSKNLTVILISHRISMLKNCDKIALIEDNKIADEGNYEYLQKNNMLFKVLLEKQKNNLSNESFK